MSGDEYSYYIYFIYINIFQYFTIILIQTKFKIYINTYLLHWTSKLSLSPPPSSPTPHPLEEEEEEVNRISP